MVQRYDIAGNVDSFCGKCKLTLIHTIETMNAGVPSRVHCNTCNSQHAYRPHAPGEGPRAKSASSSSSPRRSSSTAAPKASMYSELVRARDTTLAQPYSPRTKYVVDDLMIHPAYGIGVVMQLKDATKIEVAFPDENKVLIHGK
jgi:hypothetical protein